MAGDDLNGWLKSGLPVFHGGFDKNIARTSIEKLGGPESFRTETTIKPDGTRVVVQTKGSMPPQVFIYPPSVVEPVESPYVVRTTIILFWEVQSGYGYSIYPPETPVRLTINTDFSVTGEVATVDNPGTYLTSWSGGSSGLHMETGLGSENRIFTQYDGIFSATAGSVLDRLNLGISSYSTSWGVSGSRSVRAENGNPLPAALVIPSPIVPYNDPVFPRACKYVDIWGVQTLVLVSFHYGNVIDGYDSIIVVESLQSGALHSYHVLDLSSSLAPSSETYSVSEGTIVIARWLSHPLNQTDGYINASGTKITLLFSETTKLNGSITAYVRTLLEVDISSGSFVEKFSIDFGPASGLPFVNYLMFGYKDDDLKIIVHEMEVVDVTTDLSGYTWIPGTGSFYGTLVSTDPSTGDTTWNCVSYRTGSRIHNKLYVVGGPILDEWDDTSSDPSTFGEFEHSGASVVVQWGSELRTASWSQNYVESNLNVLKPIRFFPSADSLVIAKAHYKRTAISLGRSMSVDANTSSASHSGATFSETDSVVIYNTSTGTQQTVLTHVGYEINVPSESLSGNISYLGFRTPFPYLSRALNGGVADDYIKGQYTNYIDFASVSMSPNGMLMLLCVSASTEAMSGIETYIPDAVYPYIVRYRAVQRTPTNDDVTFNNLVLYRSSIASAFTVGQFDLSGVLSSIGVSNIGERYLFEPYYIENPS